MKQRHYFVSVTIMGGILQEPRGIIPTCSIQRNGKQFAHLNLN